MSTTDNTLSGSDRDFLLRSMHQVLDLVQQMSRNVVQALDATTARVNRLESDITQLRQTSEETDMTTPAAPASATATAGQPPRDWRIPIFVGILALLALLVYGVFFRTPSASTASAPAPAAADPAPVNFESRIAALETGFTTLKSEVKASETTVMNGLKDMRDYFDKKLGGADALEAQMARLRAACPEETLKRYTFSKADPALEKRLLDHCKAVKEKELLASPPAAAGPRVASRAPAAPATEEGEPADVDEEAPGVEIARDRIGAEPAMFRPGYGHGPRRGGPRCHGGGQWNPHFGKCMGPTRHIPISPENRAALGSCQDIQTRQVVRGNRLVTQQKGINCTHPGAMY